MNDHDKLVHLKNEAWMESLRQEGRDEAQAEIDKVMNEVYMRREETKKLRKTIREFNKHRRQF